MTALQAQTVADPASPLAPLFKPLRLTPHLTLPNRILMAPMTRSMSSPEFVPTQLSVEYYARRAAAGLLITEGTVIRPDGHGYPTTPGLYTQAQVEGWKRVTDAVHQGAGRIFSQIWHVGRLSHPMYHGQIPISASAIPATGRIPRTQNVEYGPVRAATTVEVRRLVADYAAAAANAIRAGFDGVEIHGANGYLIEQFMRSTTNQRTDEYGGDPIRRSRFALEVVDAVAAAVGSDRTAIRLSPGAYHMIEGGPDDAIGYKHVLEQLNTRNLAYVHSGIQNDAQIFPDLNMGATDFVRKHYRGTVVGVGSYTPLSAAQAIAAGRFDAIAFGRPFLANPDLVDRLLKGAELNEFEPRMLLTLY